MVGTTSDWEDELGSWLKPFLDRLGHKARRRMCPRYVAGLIGPGERKSIQPIAERFAAGDYDQLHHFIADGVWDAAPLESELLIQADRLVGGKEQAADGMLLLGVVGAEQDAGRLARRRRGGRTGCCARRNAGGHDDRPAGPVPAAGE